MSHDAEVKSEAITPSLRMRQYDEHGEVTREAMLLKEILAALKRIEELLQKPEGK